MCLRPAKKREEQRERVQLLQFPVSDPEGPFLIMASTAAAVAGGAGTGPLKLKFIFANHDGVMVEHTAEPGTLIKDLKAALVGRWPSGMPRQQIAATTQHLQQQYRRL